MVGIALLSEIEDLLLDKLDKQAQCSQYYDQACEGIRQDMLLMIFEQIDRLEHEIQSMDLLFLSKFEKIKTLNGIKDINDSQTIASLSDSEKASFKLIQKAIALITERESALETARNDLAELRLETERRHKKSTRENIAHSAYRNINK